MSEAFWADRHADASLSSPTGGRVSPRAGRQRTDGPPSPTPGVASGARGGIEAQPETGRGDDVARPGGLGLELATDGRHLDPVGDPQEGQLPEGGEVADPEVVAECRVDLLGRVDVASFRLSRCWTLTVAGRPCLQPGLAAMEDARSDEVPLTSPAVEVSAATVSAPGGSQDSILGRQDAGAFPDDRSGGDRHGWQRGPRLRHRRRPRRSGRRRGAGRPGSRGPGSSGGARRRCGRQGCHCRRRPDRPVDVARPGRRRHRRLRSYRRVGQHRGRGGSGAADGHDGGDARGIVASQRHGGLRAHPAGGPSHARCGRWRGGQHLLGARASEGAGLYRLRHRKGSEPEGDRKSYPAGYS